jgi:hypothetical protein
MHKTIVNYKIFFSIPNSKETRQSYKEQFCKTQSNNGKEWQQIFEIHIYKQSQNSNAPWTRV